MSLKILTADQLECYQRQGYLHIQSFVPETLLNEMQKPVDRWVSRIVKRWQNKGFISQDFADLPFDSRLFKAWEAAKCPPYKEYVSEEIVSPETFDFLTYPGFVMLAEDLLQGSNIQALAAFMCRPKSPTRAFPIDTPWHQDAQCMAAQDMHDTHIMTIWIPFMDVDEHNSCLQVSEGSQFQAPVYEDGKNGTVHYSLPPSVSDALGNLKTVPMKRGDVLCLHDKVAHRALPNLSDKMRWSLDIRYERFEGLAAPSPKRGFICAHENPACLVKSHEKAFAGLWSYREEPSEDKA